MTYVRRAVALGELQPGDKLREVKLAATLHVSRPTLREALNLLVQDGLLVQEPYRGFSVTRLEPAAVRDIARTRVPLDLIAVTAILEDETGRRLRMVHEAWDRYARVGPDADPLVQHEAQVTIQDIVDGLAATHRGEDPDVARAALAQAIADAGLPEQPEKWVRDTATEVVAGRQVVIDRTRRDEDDPRR